jgi:GEVED domain
MDTQWQQKMLAELLAKKQQLQTSPKDNKALVTYMATSLAWILSLYHEEALADTMVSVSGQEVETYHVSLGAGQRIKITSKPEHGRVTVDQENGTISYYPDDNHNTDSYEFEITGDEGSGALLLLTLMGIALAAAGIGAAGGGSGGSGGGGGGKGSFKAPPDHPVDYGDAPETFQTTLADDGPRHSIKPGLYLGDTPPDREENGNPDALAAGDDNTNVNDEDANDITQLVWGQNGAGDPVILYNVSNTTGEQAYLSLWVDFDGNGVFTADEQILMAEPVADGPIEIALPVDKLQEALDNNILLISRFRISTDEESVKTPGGYSPDGEVEDFVLHTIDYGDAPNEILMNGPENSVQAAQAAMSYQFPTLFTDDGARHIIREGLHLGETAPDAEIDGQPSLGAIDDDRNGAVPDDEDANDPTQSFFSFNVDENMPQLNYSIVNTTGEQAYLSLWIDTNADGTWGDDEQFANAMLVDQGAIQVLIPQSDYNQMIEYVGQGDDVYARYRLSTDPTSIAEQTGLAPDGEVEDFLVNPLLELDYGDALDFPDALLYPTLFIHDGARHYINDSLFLGTVAPDLEFDGQPTENADGDDMNGAAPHDEDAIGIASETVNIDGHVELGFSFTNTTGKDAYFSMWIDLNNDGDWNEANEAITIQQLVTEPQIIVNLGLTPLEYNAMGESNTFSRIRISTDKDAIATPTGYAPDGEVEDFISSEYELFNLDYGDAPDTYFTSLAQDGARHIKASELYLGATAPDTEADAQVSTDALGDDMDNTPDEDLNAMNEAFNSLFVRQNMDEWTFEYTETNNTGIEAFVSVWVDINADGDWIDAGEQIVNGASIGMAMGTYDFSLATSLTDAEVNLIVGNMASQNDVFMRVRISTDPTEISSFMGAANDGEVEDVLLNSLPANMDVI